jgi:hypothetical protein
MICPYNRKQLKQVVKTNYEVDDNGITKSTSQALIEDYILMECPQEECGAWQDSRCQYNQGSNG